MRAYRNRHRPIAFDKRSTSEFLRLPLPSLDKEEIIDATNITITC